MRYGLRVPPEGIDQPIGRGRHEGDPRRRASATRSSAASSSAPTPCRAATTTPTTAGPEGPHADQPRLRGGLRAGRRPGLAHRADHGVQAGREARRPDRDVSQRPGDHPRQPRRRARHLGAQRPRRRGRPARRASRSSHRRSPTTGSTASGPPLETLLDRAVGRPAARPGAGPGTEPPRSRHRPRTLLELRRRAGVARPGHGPRGPRRAQHRVQDVLRLPDRVRRRAQHAGLPDLPGPARRDAGRQRQGRRVGHPDRAGAQLRDRRVVPLRPEELLLPGHAEELPDQPVRRAHLLRRLDRRPDRRRDGPRPSGRDRARPHGGGHRQVDCTSAVRPVGSRAPTTRWSTTTAPASR